MCVRNSRFNGTNLIRRTSERLVDRTRRKHSDFAEVDLPRREKRKGHAACIIPVISCWLTTTNTRVQKPVCPLTQICLFAR